MPLGLVRSGDYRNGTPIVLPHTFGTPANNPEPQGNVLPQANTSLDSNIVSWTPSPAHFGNTVDLSLQTVAPIVIIISPGSTGTTNINLTQLLGTSTPTLTYSGAPSGVTLAFAPNPDTGTSVCTVTVGASVPAGKYTITIIGTSGGEVNTTNLHLVVANSSQPAVQIAFVGSGSAHTSVTQLNSTITVPYNSTSGNALLLQLTCSNDGGGVGFVESVIDSNGTNWTPINTEVSPSVDYQEVWGITNSPAITSVTVTVSGSATNPNNGLYLSASVTEYSGVAAIGTSSTNSGPSEPATISQTLTTGGNWLVGFFLTGQPSTPATVSSGVLRSTIAFAPGTGHANSSVDTLTWMAGGAGQHFVPNFTGLVSWSGNPITYNGVTFTVSSVPSANSLILTTSPGTLSNEVYAYNAQGPGNSIQVADNTSASASSVTITVSQGASDQWGAMAVELIAA